MAEAAEIPAIKRESKRDVRAAGMLTVDPEFSRFSARVSRMPCSKFQPTEKAADATHANRVGRMKL